MWTDEQWDAFVTVVGRGFAAREAFTDEDARVYRLLLDAVDPEAAMTALRELVLEGQALRPRPGEIVARCRRDPSRPTFAEAYRLIFGPGGVLRARPSRHEFLEAPDPDAAVRDAVMDRARQVHPLVGQFVARQGIERLLVLPVDCPDWGEKHRRDLERTWDAHVEAFDGREVAALAAGGRDGLRRLDPLVGLGAPSLACGDDAHATTQTTPNDTRSPA